MLRSISISKFCRGQCSQRFAPALRGPCANTRRRCYATTALHTSQNFPKFPGAKDSRLTTDLNFTSPAQLSIIPTYHVLDSEGRLANTQRPEPAVSESEALNWYKNMLTVNIMDSIMFEAQRHGRLSFYMVSAGEEAIMVGSAAALQPEDVITCQYREHGVFLQRGFTLPDFMNQLVANRLDPGKGRNMPVHYSGKAKVNIHAVASTLGTQIPHAVGAALAFKSQDATSSNPVPRVAVAYFGDGAASEGDFHGALNLAAVLELPVIFLCRNNGYAISTPTSQQYRGDGIASRGTGYGIDSIRVDGTDIFAVFEATQEARRRALENGGRPILLEMMSYRVSHHSTSDDSTAYRNSEEVKQWQAQHSPLIRLRKWLEQKGVWNEDLESETKSQLRKDIIRELSLAEKEQKPALREIFTDVYANLTEEAEAQRQEMKRILLEYPHEYDLDQHEKGIEGI